MPIYYIYQGNKLLSNGFARSMLKHLNNISRKKIKTAGYKSLIRQVLPLSLTN